MVATTEQPDISSYAPYLALMSLGQGMQQMGTGPSDTPPTNTANSTLSNTLALMQMRKEREQAGTAPAAQPTSTSSASPLGGGGGVPLASMLSMLNGGGTAAGATGATGTAGATGATGTAGATGATGAGAAGGAGAGAAGAGAAAMAIPAAIAAAIMGGKELEQRESKSPLGRGLLSGLGPSFSQVKEDPKLALTTLLGVPFINGAIRSDKAGSATTDWRAIFK